jgi:Cyclic nucleotide-binding domain
LTIWVSAKKNEVVIAVSVCGSLIRIVPRSAGVSSLDERIVKEDRVGNNLILTYNGDGSHIQRGAIIYRLSVVNESLKESLNELYQSLPAEICQELGKYEKRMTVAPGVRLIMQGLCPEHLIIVDEGSVEISIPAGDHAIFLVVAGQGKVCGLCAIVGGVLSEIDATTLEHCEITAIANGAFTDMVKQHPEMYAAIAKVLSGDLKTAGTFLRQNTPYRQRR